jgi:hypothetical protein
VKQSDFGEYEENAKEKQKIQIYKIKHQLPLKPSHTNGKYQVQKSRGKQRNMSFLNGKRPYSP